MRRGMALAAERRYRRALADMNRACALEPDNVHYRLRRGRVYRAHGQAALALKDFDAAIRERPDFYPAHLARARLLLSWPHAPADARRLATTDINIAALLAPDASVQRLQVADLYARIGRYSDALRAINLWIYFHRRDALLPYGWDTRCWIRAEGNLQLHRALRDCTRAAERLPKTSGVFEDRALVYLRLDRLHQAIASYDQALRMKPRLAAALYGRGLAELRTRQTAAGRADLAAAMKIDPDVTRLFAHMHLTP
jgi:tetratricopeptide (TPR) repeat protein